MDIFGCFGDAGALLRASLGRSGAGIFSLSFCVEGFLSSLSALVPFPGRANSVGYGTYGDEQKAIAVKEHYRQRESSKYSKELGKESSEDVWKSRDKKVEWGEAFNAPFPGFSGTDEEWRQRELDRRSGKVDGSMG